MPDGIPNKNPTPSLNQAFPPIYWFYINIICYNGNQQILQEQIQSQKMAVDISPPVWPPKQPAKNEPPTFSFITPLIIELTPAPISPNPISNRKCRLSL